MTPDETPIRDDDRQSKPRATFPRKKASVTEDHVRGRIAAYNASLARGCDRCGRLETGPLLTHCLAGYLCPACLESWLDTLHVAERAAKQGGA